MQQGKIGYNNSIDKFSLPPHRCVLTLYRSQKSLSMVGSKWLFKSRHLDRVLKILLRYSKMEFLNNALARSSVIKYNLCTITKRDLYINAYNAYQSVSWYKHYQCTSYIDERTCLIWLYHMHGNPVRIYILLGIARTSLKNVKVRCVGKDNYVYEFVCIRVCMSVTLLRPHIEISPLDWQCNNLIYMKFKYSIYNIVYFQLIC